LTTSKIIRKGKMLFSEDYKIPPKGIKPKDVGKSLGGLVE